MPPLRLCYGSATTAPPPRFCHHGYGMVQSPHMCQGSWPLHYRSPINAAPPSPLYRCCPAAAAPPLHLFCRSATLTLPPPLLRRRGSASDAPLPPLDCHHPPSTADLLLRLLRCSASVALPLQLCRRGSIFMDPLSYLHHRISTTVDPPARLRVNRCVTVPDHCSSITAALSLRLRHLGSATAAPPPLLCRRRCRSVTVTL